ncbi:hypothetical protein [Halococcus hamelinensis]|uniref:hypothetical protein n=1 Tax=Halococcus hamelinensis TaxID=332168 RepID=UPI000A67C190|nr:hypothetical protein [Halococcus hamelinensis]
MAAPLLVGVVTLGVGPLLATAHVPSTGATVGFRFPVLVVGSALVGSLGGVGVILARVRRPPSRFGGRGFSGALGVGLSLVGVLVLLPLGPSKPGLALLAGASGVLGAIGLSRRTRVDDDRAVALSTTGALTLHQFVEGTALAGAYIAGGVVGVTAAVLLTLHTVAETAVVAGTHVSAADTSGAVVAVGLMQTVYVVAAGVTFAVAWSIPLFVQDLAAAGAAAVLLAVGVRECWSVVAGRPPS